MTARRPPGARRKTRLLDARSGGIVIVAAALLFVIAALRWIVPAFQARGSRAVGDGRHPESYGFDLSNLDVERDVVVAAGIPRDGIPALTLPRLYTAREAAEAPLGEHGKLLVAGDLVLGIERNGAARCYPLRVLNWHEVVNDTLGGEPVVVSFNPPSYGVAAFSRRVGDEVLIFGVSGLLYESNLLLYDRREAAAQVGSSLWSQLLARAVSGPAAGRQLTLLPVTLESWQDWLGRYPETTVLAGDARRARNYERDPYAAYYSSDEIRFRVEPMPPAHHPSPKTRVLVAGEGRGAIAIPFAGVDSTQVESVRVGDRSARFRYRPDPPSLALELGDGATSIPTRYAFWFVWYAISAAESLREGPGDQAPGSPTPGSPAS